MEKTEILNLIATKYNGIHFRHSVIFEYENWIFEIEIYKNVMQIKSFENENDYCNEITIDHFIFYRVRQSLNVNTIFDLIKSKIRVVKFDEIYQMK